MDVNPNDYILKVSFKSVHWFRDIMRYFGNRETQKHIHNDKMQKVDEKHKEKHRNVCMESYTKVKGVWISLYYKCRMV